MVKTEATASNAPRSADASLVPAFALVAISGLGGLLNFLWMWTVQAPVEFPPSPQDAARVIAAVPLWAHDLAFLFLVAALLFPAVAAALSAAPARGTGEDRVRAIWRHWMLPPVALALVVLAGGTAPWLIHLLAPRDSHLWWTQFGLPHQVEAVSTIQVLILEGARQFTVALAVLGLGCLLVGVATRIAHATGRPVFASGLTVALAALGLLAVETTVLERHLWLHPQGLPAALAAALWALCLPVWWAASPRARY